MATNKALIAQQLYRVWDVAGEDHFFNELDVSGLTPEEYKAARIRTGHSGVPLSEVDISDVPMEVYYNNLDWDTTDIPEVDLLNLALQEADQPLYAMDCVLDMGMKLLNVLERTTYHDITLYGQVDKMTAIHTKLTELAERFKLLRFKEDKR